MREMGQRAFKKINIFIDFRFFFTVENHYIPIMKKRFKNLIHVVLNGFGELKVENFLIDENLVHL